MYNVFNQFGFKYIANKNLDLLMTCLNHVGRFGLNSIYKYK
jgi:hypothetical protein